MGEDARFLFQAHLTPHRGDFVFKKKWHETSLWIWQGMLDLCGVGWQGFAFLNAWHQADGNGL